MQYYNVHIENFNDTYTLIKLPEDDLLKLVDAFDYGKDSVFINGTSRVLMGLKEIKIFNFKDPWETFHGWNNSSEVRPYHIFSRLTGRIAIDPYALGLKGDDLTKEFINNDFGWKKETRSGSDDILKLKKHYINLDRIDNLKKTKNKELDFSKLVRICEEINICYNLNCFFAVGNLVRALIDHIPPIFGFRTFGEVANNYSGTTSFKDAMQQLDKSLRKISDSFLHTAMRKSEVLPNQNQVEFIASIDLLISEIIRINRNK